MHILIAAVVTAIAAREGYYRQPAICGDTVVFVAEGDLWRVSRDGGLAMRLTTHPGPETHPAISPDGRTVAFAASYEGPTEVYTMPIEGGPPTRRTWHADRTRVEGFAPDGRLLYATRAFAGLRDEQMVALDLEAGTTERLPLSQAAHGTFDATGTVLFFNRLPFQGSHTKRYRGGTAQRLWRFDAAAGTEAVNLTADYTGTSREPMWLRDRVYFASDRDGTMNIWSMLPDGSDLRQHTRHTAWEVRSPSSSTRHIVYQRGADLHVLDPVSGVDGPIPITLASDFDQMREKWVSKPMDTLSAAHIAPDGERVALTARGEVFVAPRRQGRLVHVSRRPDVRYRDARFMPDGEHLLAFSDESGEVEMWLLDPAGIEPGRQLTRDGDVLRTGAVPSPDGTLIAHHDKNWRLWLHDVAAGTDTVLDEARYDAFGDLRWSPDGQWLAYVETAANQLARIKLYSIADGSITFATSDRFSSYEPAWSDDGAWLYFLSDRHFSSLVRSPWGNRQPEPFFDRTTRIYAIALQPGLRSPFQPDDELSGEAEKDEPDDEVEADAGEEPLEKGDTAEEEPPPVVIELDGLSARLHDVPVEPGNYGQLLWSARSATRTVPRPPCSWPRSPGRNSRRTASGCSCARKVPCTSSTPVRVRPPSSTRRRSTSPAGRSRWRRARSGGRCSRTPGDSSATISTTATCTASTGPRCSTATSRSLIASAIARSSRI
jgi:tricorn protease